MKRLFFILVIGLVMTSCSNQTTQTSVKSITFQTSSNGDKWAELPSHIPLTDVSDTIEINTNQLKQEVIGFGGSFTESSAHLLFQLSPDKRNEVLRNYFSEQGSNYTLCRTHMNSCDFSIGHYSYAETPNDTFLTKFSVDPDLDDIVPMINLAKEYSLDGFKLIASPWTAPPWMKDNNAWNGGKLLPEFRETWADFFAKHYHEYSKLDIDIWAYTVENEPLGNDENWESMHYTAEEMGDFVKEFLGPKLEQEGVKAKILMYDQNRGEELEEWSLATYSDSLLKTYVYGMAVHWYTSTIDWMAGSLNYTHNLAPEKHIIHTEGCIDADVPHWKDDNWYWSKEATDWGWDWASEDQKPDHPKYVPAFRYARDIIGCLNNWVEGWVDWNMVLDERGGPNLASNWCNAPVIVSAEKNEVYYTPLYYVIGHFSKYIRPGAKVIDIKNNASSVMITSAVNPNGEIVMVALNQLNEPVEFVLNVNGNISTHKIDGEAIQTIIVK